MSGSGDIRTDVNDEDSHLKVSFRLPDFVHFFKYSLFLSLNRRDYSM